MKTIQADIKNPLGSKCFIAILFLIPKIIVRVLTFFSDLKLVLTRTIILQCCINTSYITRFFKS